MDTLHQFQQNTVIRDAVEEYLVDFLKEKVIERAFAGGETKDLAEAKKLINQAFANLDGKYAPKKNNYPNSK